ncbi:MAG: phosphoribosylformylglycinamidine cyclo-ligase [Elusimicrobiota bacterium]
MNLYRESGVDIDKAEGLVESLKKKYPSIGGYAGVYRLNGTDIAATCDGVGTKIKLACMLDNHSGIGIDLVAMSVNDLIAGGARPLFFLDYFSCGKLEENLFSRIMDGISRGVKQAGCVLLGGETAEMPGMYEGGEYDLAGFAVGKIEKRYSTDEVKSGDRIIGYPSSGVHSNGFSLVRKIFSPGEIKELGEELLAPTLIYSGLIESPPGIKNLAHVTGGGLVRALKRLLGENKESKLNINEFSSVFKKIHLKGVDKKQMLEVFNCGWGMLALAGEKEAFGIADSTGGSIIGTVI